MLSDERYKEMQRKFMELGRTIKPPTPISMGPIPATEAIMELAVSIPDVLVSLGIAKDMDEGEAFLASMCKGAMMAMATGHANPTEGLYTVDESRVPDRIECGEEGGSGDC